MFRNKSDSPIGLDLRSNALRMVQLKRTGQGWRVGDAVLKESDLPGGSDSTRDHERLIGEIRRSLKEGAFSGRAVVSTLPENQVDIFPIKLSLKADDDLEGALVQEAGAYLSYDLAEAVIDYIVVQDTPFGSEQKRTVNLLLIAARQAHVDAHLALLRGAGLKPVAIETPSCALARLLRMSAQGAGENLLLIDMDEAQTTLAVLCNQTILLERTLSWGRERLVQRLGHYLKLDSRKCQDLLTRVGLSHGTAHEGSSDAPASPVTAQMMQTVSEIVDPEMERLVQEVEKVLIYFAAEMRGERMDALCLMGRCAAFRNLDGALAAHLALPTRILDPIAALDLQGQTPLEDDSDGGRIGLGVALGMALRGAALPKPVEEAAVL